MRKRSTFIGLDVHKESIAVAIAEGGRFGEVRAYGSIGGEVEALNKVVRTLRAPGRTLHFVYEAGPCGFTVFRHLRQLGEDCAVVSSSMTPKRAGDRVKTDRRDALTLARLHRAGELRAIYVPNESDEALRDLVRAREDGVEVAREAKQRVKAFVLRHGFRYRGHAGWTIPYRRWLAGLTMPEAAPQIALQEYLATVDEAEQRVARLTAPLQHLVPAWRWAPVVDALQALRGVSFITQRARPRNRNRLWKLPEPWTPRTRPPLLGKPHSTRFPTATTGPIIGNQSVTHVPGLLCYLSSRLLTRVG
jgi:transposase